jgi:putative proteasome-type protease
VTYCLGILLPDALVLAADSRSNAGVDQIAKVRKLDIIETAGERCLCIMSAGNLATTQSLVTELKQGFGNGNPVDDLALTASMFEAARAVGEKLRHILSRDGKHVRPYGDPSASFLLGGQIGGERHRLFQIYAAGNFIEATPRNQFLQIGETKYGKPILDRALTFDTSVGEAAKLALISFDATIRSNLSVAPPVDLLIYRANALAADTRHKFNDGDPYWSALRRGYSDGLMQVVRGLPDLEA